jgi:GNAT superfamily N-acetyltransferase
VRSHAASPFVFRPAAWPSARRSDPADVPALLDFLSEGLRSYRAFAPEAWVPPDQNTPDKVERTLTELADPRTYSRLAEAEGHIVGFVHTCRPDPPVDVRLRYLFVAESHWGTGLAQELHDGAVADLADSTARLFTPTDHFRARRFYVRQGWRLHDTAPVSKLGIDLVEYRRP